jgi:hypothetical protein
MVYYDINNKLFTRFRALEINYKTIAAEIPNFDQKKVTIKRDEGVWHNKKTDLHENIFQQLSSNREWIAGWDPDNKWYNFPLILKDAPIGFAKEICPNTIEILQSIGGINTAGFAILLPHSRLPLHADPTGPTYGTMAFNMLLYGEKSSLIVGESYAYEHKLGKAVIFNSELPHYARNDSDDIRTILYMDILYVEKPLSQNRMYYNQMDQNKSLAIWDEREDAKISVRKELDNIESGMRKETREKAMSEGTYNEDD